MNNPSSPAASGLIRQLYSAAAAGGKQHSTCPPGKTPILLPGNDRMITEFAHDLGLILADKEIFCRDSIVGLLNPTHRRLDPIEDGRVLLTWAEQYIWAYKSVTDPKTGFSIQVGHSMTRDHAETSLRAPQFTVHLRQLKRINALSLPILDSTGKLRLLTPGYDPDTQTYTFPWNN